MTTAPASIEGRPFRNEPTSTLKTALALVSAEARRVAATGPKRQEDALHLVVDHFLTELQQRGDLHP